MDEETPTYQLPNPNYTGQIARFAPQQAAQQANAPAVQPQIQQQATPYNFTVPQSAPPQAAFPAGQPSGNPQLSGGFAPAAPYYLGQPQQAQPQDAQAPYQLAPQAAADNSMNTKDVRDSIKDAAIGLLNQIKTGQTNPSKAESMLGGIIDGIGSINGGRGIISGLANGISNARRQKEASTQRAYENLKRLTDVVGVTQVKPLIEAVKQQHLAAEDQRRSIKDQMMNQYNMAKEKRIGEHQKALESFDQKKLELQKYGIDTKSFDAGEQRKMMQEYYNQTDKRVRDIATLNAHLALNRNDQAAQIALMHAKQTMDNEQAQTESKINQFNNNIALKLQERDKDGNLKYHNDKGEPLDPSHYMLKFDGFNNTLPNIGNSSQDAEEADAIARYTQPNPIASQQGGAPPQQPNMAQPQQVGAGPQQAVAAKPQGIQMDAIQARAKQLGMSKFQAFNLFVQAAHAKGYTEDEAYELAKKSGF